jgi:hypothetical protein
VTDDREPHVKCTEFITDHYEGRKGTINTEYETPEQWKYRVLLARLGDEDNGFNIPSAEDKGEIIDATMVSYKRQGRQENVVALCGAGQGSNSVMSVGSLPVTPMTRPNELQASAEGQKKKHWWSRGSK